MDSDNISILESRVHYTMSSMRSRGGAAATRQHCRIYLPLYDDDVTRPFAKAIDASCSQHLLSGKMHGVTLLLPPPDVQASIVAKLMSGDPDAMAATKLTIKKLVIAECLTDGTKVKKLGTLGGIELAVADKKKSSITLVNGCVLTPHPSWQFIADDGEPANLAVWNCSAAPPTDGEPFTVVRKKVRGGGPGDARSSEVMAPVRTQLVDGMCRDYNEFRKNGKPSDPDPITCLASAILNYLESHPETKTAVYAGALKLTTMDPLSTVLLILSGGENPLVSDARLTEFTGIKSACVNKGDAETNFVQHVNARAAQISPAVVSSACALHARLVNSADDGSMLKDGYDAESTPVTDEQVVTFFEDMAKLYAGLKSTDKITDALKAEAKSMHIVSEFQFVAGVTMDSLRQPGANLSMLSQFTQNNWRYLSSSRPRIIVGEDSIMSSNSISALRNQYIYSSALAPPMSSDQLKVGAATCNTFAEHTPGKYFNLDEKSLKALDVANMARTTEFASDLDIIQQIQNKHPAKR